jgi:MFS family permease
LLDAFGWSRGATAGVFSVVLAVDAILSPVVGYLLDRFGTKAIVSSGCLILALGLLLSSVIGSLWQLYIFFGLISAIGITFTGMVPHVFLVSEWFVANRASAIGFVYAGTGVGILLLAPLSEWLLSTWGWPRAFQTFSGIVLLLLFPLVWIFYQHGPFGERVRSKKESKPNGLAGITSSFGRVVFGFIADLLTKQAAYTLNILMTLVGVGALMILRDPSQTWLLYVYVIFFGIGFGSRAVIFSALTADIFSGKGFGSILGYSTVAVGVGGALGSWLGGAFFDWTRSYLVSFALSALVLGCSDVCIWLASMASVANRDQRLFGSNA